MKKFTSETLLAIMRSPGAQYLVHDDKTSLVEMNAGFADVMTKRSVDSSITFNAYSTTKTVTAAAVMQLVEQNKISLDEPVNTHFPEFSFSGKFTVRQLLSHQSGIGNPLPLKWIHLAEEDESFDGKSFASQIITSNTKLRFKPGRKMSYSNVGYLLLGLLIEKISGVDYKTFINENVFRKALNNEALSFKMKSSTQATGYHPKFSFSNFLLTLMIDKRKYMTTASVKWVAFRNHYVNGTAYGGLIANAQGLTKYLRAFLNGSIVNENSLSNLFSVQRDNMCLGWYSGRLGSHSYFCHAGGGGGYYCEIRVYPELKICSVVMTNRTGFSDQRLLDKLDAHFIS